MEVLEVYGVDITFWKFNTIVSWFSSHFLSLLYYSIFVSFLYLGLINYLEHVYVPSEIFATMPVWDCDLVYFYRVDGVWFWLIICYVGLELSTTCIILWSFHFAQICFALIRAIMVSKCDKESNDLILNLN